MRFEKLLAGISLFSIWRLLFFGLHNFRGL